jgi:hypothetical protein
MIGHGKQKEKRYKGRKKVQRSSPHPCHMKKGKTTENKRECREPAHHQY